MSSPTGCRILGSAQQWNERQISDAPELAAPNMCAANISRVLAAAGLPHYDSMMAMGLINDIRRQGGIIIELPQRKRVGEETQSSSADSRFHNELISVFDEIYQGRLPTGTIVVGCMHRPCNGTERGTRHSGVVGHTTRHGNAVTYWLWHNNWYRPDNEDGKWKKHMINRSLYEWGFRRQWMATPWLTITYEGKRISSIRSELPAVEDLDPTTGYHIRLAIPREIVDELQDS